MRGEGGDVVVLHRLVGDTGGVAGVEGGAAGDVAGGHGALLDGGHHGGARDRDDGAADDLGGVDEVAADVTQGPRAHGALVTPGHGSGGVDAVVAPVTAVEVVDLAQVALGDEFGELGHSGVAAVGEAHAGDDAGFFLGLGHGAGALERVRQGLLAQDVLAGLDEGLGDLAVQGVAHHDGDDVNVRVLSHCPPVVHGALVAVALSGVLGEGEVGVGDGVQTDLR